VKDRDSKKVFNEKVITKMKYQAKMARKKQSKIDDNFMVDCGKKLNRKSNCIA
jgi:hypothetical protein